MRARAIAVLVAGMLGGLAVALGAESSKGLDAELARVLKAQGFTGHIESRFREKLGRPIDRQRANLGRLLWFDIIGGLNDDNTCGGCHSPTHGFGDTQSIAIGIDNNRIVGPDRAARATSAATPTCRQHGVLSHADVELALRRALRRPVRQQRRLPVPAARGAFPLAPAAPARRPGVHPADRACRGGRIRLPR